MSHLLPIILPRALLISSLLALASTTLAADAPQKVRVKKLQGTVKEVGEKQIIMTDAKDQEISLKLGSKCEIEVVGTTDAAYLTPGVPVHFLAELTTSLSSPDPLPAITVCNIDDDTNRPLCILADPTASKKKGPDAKNMMEVRGTIKTNKNSRMTIEVKSVATKKTETVKVVLAPDIKVAARFTNLERVTPGDTVEVPSGTESEPGVVRPRSLKITLAKPLVAEEADTKPKTTRKTSTKSGT